jgi:chorismate--pyruvate lyase
MTTLTTCWHPHTRYLRTALPSGLADWLLDPASLTRRLQTLCPGHFEVRVLLQRRGRPTSDEALLLGMRHNSNALVREVQLLCNGQPWVYARTVIPGRSMRGRLRRLARLGNRPLGAVLFADPGMRRGGVELACILPGEALHSAANAGDSTQEPVWGRRSVFRIAGHPLLVSEIFLPAFPASADRTLWNCR